MAGSATITGRQNYVLGIGHPKTNGDLEGSPSVARMEYLGLVATRQSVPSHFIGSSKQLAARTKHIATEDISVMQLLFTNWYCAVAGGEQNPGASSTVKYSVEYPVGTIITATFGGQSSGTVADGENLLTDPITVNIPRGAPFYVRTWYSNSAGIIYNNNYALNNVNGSVPASGEWCTFGTTTPDMTGTASNSNNQQSGICFKPAAILGYTTKPTYLLIGDSRLGNGTIYDATVNSWGGIGEVDRSLCKKYATLNAGRAGEKASDAAGSSATKRIALAQYVSAVVCNYGINDCIAATAAATTFTNLQTLGNKFGGKPVFQCTVTPKSTSTDSWATTVNQSVDATSNPLRVALNNLIRNGMPAPFVGHIEVADQVESARDSGIWKATGSANGYTADGLHGNSAGNSLIEISTAFKDAFQ